MYTLRGHHLLCIHGFKGMGYSPEFVEKMTEIVSAVRDTKQDFQIRVVRALDDTCWTCPHHGQTTCEKDPASNAHVLQLDANVIHHLGLEDGGIYAKSELVELVAQRVEPEDLEHLCEGCSWLSYGVCKDGIAELKKTQLELNS